MISPHRHAEFFENFLCLTDDDAEYRVTSTKKEIHQYLSGDEELPSQVAASVRLMKAAMYVDHEKLLSGNYYDSPYDAVIDIFDDDIMKEIVIDTNRYAHQVIGKAKATEESWRKDTDIELLYFRNIMTYDRYILLTKCLHFSDNDKQPLPNAKSSKQPLAASYGLDRQNRRNELTEPTPSTS
ncbi:hypothetical protein EVAR_89201_1 [Eumeta japonica]|uniref:PiggyBac transposable element-derived protein domain-containing protein n=1 Tax=Eumeta variegata TaxID=151549 RepID=A0A4C1YB47_EUMVA|nr:hypothetical protein EVAR_89201_1 [Eumeta japonica]